MGGDGSLPLISLRDVWRSSTTARIKALKAADLTLGRLLVSGVRAQAGGGTETPALRRVLVLRPGGIGDAVLLVPALRALKAAVPEARITVAAERRNAAVFDLAPGLLDSRLVLDASLLSSWRAIRRGGFDTVMDTEQYHHLSAWLAHASGAPRRIGFAANPARHRCYTMNVPYHHEDFEGDSFTRLVSAAAGRELAVDWLRPWLTPPAASALVADAVGGRQPVALAVQGGIRERCWAVDNLQALAKRLIEQGHDVCLLGGDSDVGIAACVQRGLPPAKIVNLIGHASLADSTAILARCRLWIGPDSGPMHLAAGLGVPVVALFGAGIEAKWAPRGPRHRALNRRLPCSPCTRFGYTPRCPINVQCLRDLTVDDVWRAAQDALGHP